MTLLKKIARLVTPVPTRNCNDSGSAMSPFHASNDPSAAARPPGEKSSWSRAKKWVGIKVSTLSGTVSAAWRKYQQAAWTCKTSLEYSTSLPLVPARSGFVGVGASGALRLHYNPR